MRVWKGRMIANQWSALTVFKQELTPLYPTPTDNSQAKGHLSWGQRALPLCWSERRCYGNGTGWSVARWKKGGGGTADVPGTDVMLLTATCFKLHSGAEGEHLSGWGLMARPAQFNNCSTIIFCRLSSDEWKEIQLSRMLGKFQRIRTFTLDDNIIQHKCSGQFWKWLCWEDFIQNYVIVL